MISRSNGAFRLVLPQESSDNEFALAFKGTCRNTFTKPVFDINMVHHVSLP